MRAIDADALLQEFPLPNDITDTSRALIHITGVRAAIECAETIFATDSVREAFDKICNRINEQEALGRKIFKDEDDIEAWEKLKIYFSEDEG